MSYSRLTPFGIVAFLILGCASDDPGNATQQAQPVEWKCASSDKLCMCKGDGDPSFYTEASCAAPNTCCRLEPDDVCACGPYVGEECTTWVGGFGDYQAVASCPPP